MKTEGLRRTTTLGRDRKLQKEAWMQRRFEESSLEKLQVGCLSCRRATDWCSCSCTAAKQSPVIIKLCHAGATLSTALSLQNS